MALPDTRLPDLIIALKEAGLGIRVDPDMPGVRVWNISHPDWSVQVLLWQEQPDQTPKYFQTSYGDRIGLASDIPAAVDRITTLLTPSISSLCPETPACCMKQPPHSRSVEKRTTQ